MDYNFKIEIYDGLTQKNVKSIYLIANIDRKRASMRTKHIKS
jgi:hypothetical protein